MDDEPFIFKFPSDFHSLMAPFGLLLDALLGIERMNPSSWRYKKLGDCLRETLNEKDGRYFYIIIHRRRAAA